jgi:hypothetical protein
LLPDEGVLNRMRILRSAQAFEGHDFLARSAGNGKQTGSNRQIVEEHSAGPALTQTATKLGVVEGEVIPENV